MALRKRVGFSPKGRLKPLQVTDWWSARASAVGGKRRSGESRGMLVIFGTHHVDLNTMFGPPPASI